MFSKEGFEPPVVYWMPSIALSGMAFYTGNKLPKWKGDVFVGGQRTGEIPGTGHLERILFNEKLEELRRESLLVALRMRIRDVRQGPDELLYVLVDHEERRRPADRAVGDATKTDDVPDASISLRPAGHAPARLPSPERHAASGFSALSVACPRPECGAGACGRDRRGPASWWRARRRRDVQGNPLRRLDRRRQSIPTSRQTTTLDRHRRCVRIRPACVATGARR